MPSQSPRFGLFKKEALVRKLPFTTEAFRTIGDLEEVTFDWVDWYNN